MEAFCLSIFDLFEAEMASEIDGGEEAKELERVHSPHDANIELAIVEIGVRSYFHSAAVSRGVCDRDQNCGMKRGAIIAV